MPTETSVVVCGEGVGWIEHVRMMRLGSPVLVMDPGAVMTPLKAGILFLQALMMARLELPTENLARRQ